MKPLVSAVIVITGNHITVRYLVTETVPRFVGVEIPVYGGSVLLNGQSL
jgi:hypothetical protein